MPSAPAVPQVLLPGQAAAPEGPIDMIGMYMMHFAFRRDLDAFVRVVPATPVADRAAWKALAERWEFFGFMLHHHHSAEDDTLWPPLLEAVDAAGETDARRVLDDMEAEHGAIDPLLEACRAGFRRLAEVADPDAQAALEVRLVAARRTLDHHLGHEESDAIPLIQRHIEPAAQWPAIEKAISSGYPARYQLRILGWVMYRTPAQGREALFRQPGAGVFRLPWKWWIGPRFARREERVFGRAGAGIGV